MMQNNSGRATGQPVMLLSEQIWTLFFLCKAYGLHAPAAMSLTILASRPSPG